MDTLLAVLVDGESDEKLLESVSEYAKETGSEVILSNYMDGGEYESKLQRKIKTDPDIATQEKVEQKVKEDAQEIANEYFGDQTSYTVSGTVGPLPGSILQDAKEKDCDHVFITGKQRSPAGKAIFGDIAQAVVLDFEGPVTITTKSL